jgi:uncharacterized protein YjbI with pentapeptide repeats
VRGTIFKNCKLVAAGFFDADLSNCDFTGANLSQANLELANLKGAILKDAIVTEAYVSGSTKMEPKDITGKQKLSFKNVCLAVCISVLAVAQSSVQAAENLLIASTVVCDLTVEDALFQHDGTPCVRLRAATTTVFPQS